MILGLAFASPFCYLIKTFTTKDNNKASSMGMSQDLSDMFGVDQNAPEALDNWIDEITSGEERLTTTNCKKCNSTGYLPDFKRIERGMCFDCYGWGSVLVSNRSSKKYKLHNGEYAPRFRN